MSNHLPGRLAAILVPLAIALSPPSAWAGELATRHVLENGIVKVKSIYPMAETVDRLKKEVASKGIMFFASIDQSGLAAEAGIRLRPSTLLVFGNPALGSKFIEANPLAGVDWPVRLLVTQDEEGDVWAVYNDFGYMARRHRITDREEAFGMASEVIASITSSVAK
jgi:uncharacterized protein (DUF302 family)